MTNPESKATTPCAWVCTDYDSSCGVGMTKELAQEAAGAGCTEFFGLVAGPALATKLLALADELDAELDSGAKWSKAQHTCSSVSVALRDIARAASAT
ncbi:hypothetical protein PEC18_18835 [Paucibacter sp. O1-1]|nr:hypothetical protein [Paucibacter sp. O1-1]MDA3827854.1 hypothetical protein [Paucibacter sp. O1-1]